MRLFGFRLTPEADIDDTRLSILDHLEELRGRLLKSIAAVALFFPLCWYFCGDVIDWFLEVACGDLPKVQTLAVMELFFTEMKVSFFMALVLAYPVMAFQAWRFVAPGLYRHERYYVSRFVVASTALFIAGAEMALFLVFPKVVRFGAGMARGKIEVAPQLSSVISLAGWLMLGFGVMFQLPIVVYLLAITGLVSVDTMRKARPIVVIAIFTLAAILTPTPDVVTQCALAIPSYLLFEASILFTQVAVRRKHRREEEEKRREEEEQRQRLAGDQPPPPPPDQPPPQGAAPAAPEAPAGAVPGAPADVTAPATPPAPAAAGAAPGPFPQPGGERLGAGTAEGGVPGAGWERWYGNVTDPAEEPLAAAPPAETQTAPSRAAAPMAAAPGAPPGTGDAEAEETLGSGPV